MQVDDINMFLCIIPPTVLKGEETPRFSFLERRKEGALRIFLFYFRKLYTKGYSQNISLFVNFRGKKVAMGYRPAPGHKWLRISGTLLFLLGISLTGMMLLLLMNLEGFLFGRNALFRLEFRKVIEVFLADALLTGVLLALFGVLGFRWSQKFEKAKTLLILGGLQLLLLMKLAVFDRLLGDMENALKHHDILPVFYASLLLPLLFLLGAYKNYRALKEGMPKNADETHPQET